MRMSGADEETAAGCHDESKTVQNQDFFQQI